MWCKKLFEEIKRFLTEEDAASLIEYALVMAAGTLVATALKPSLHQVAHLLNRTNESEFDHFIQISGR